MKTSKVLLILALAMFCAACTSRRVVVEREKVADLNDAKWTEVKPAK